MVSTVPLSRPDNPSNYFLEPTHKLRTGAQGAGQAAGQAVAGMAPQVMEQIMAGGSAPVQGGGMPGPGGA